MTSGSRNRVFGGILHSARDVTAIVLGTLLPHDCVKVHANQPYKMQYCIMVGRRYGDRPTYGRPRAREGANGIVPRTPKYGISQAVLPGYPNTETRC